MTSMIKTLIIAIVSGVIVVYIDAKYIRPNVPAQSKMTTVHEIQQKPSSPSSSPKKYRSSNPHIGDAPIRHTTQSEGPARLSNNTGVIRISISGDKNVIAFSRSEGRELVGDFSAASSRKYYLFKNDGVSKYEVVVQGNRNIVEGGSKETLRNVSVNSPNGSKGTQTRYAVIAHKNR